MVFSLPLKINGNVILSLENYGGGEGEVFINNGITLNGRFSGKPFILPSLSTFEILIFIENPIAGMIVYNTDSQSLWFYDEVMWRVLQAF